MKNNKKANEFNHLEIYNMELHDILVIGPAAEIVRVPGGWIYEIKTNDIVNHTFVPFDNEFRNGLQ